MRDAPRGRASLPGYITGAVRFTGNLLYAGGSAAATGGMDVVYALSSRDDSVQILDARSGFGRRDIRLHHQPEDAWYPVHCGRPTAAGA